MGIFSTFFNPPKPRRFEYIPRYFDAEKEAKEQRRKRIEQEVKRERGHVISDDEYVPHIRGQFRATKEKNARIIHRQNIRRIYIFIILLFLAYILYTRLV